MPLKTPVEKYFLGRSKELETLYGIASEVNKGIATSVFLSGQHGAGKTELLNQLFHLFFHEQDKVAPFIYTVNPALISVADFSKDYLDRFIRQRLAFEKKDVSLIHAYGLSFERLIGIGEESGVHWIGNIIEQYFKTKQDGDPLKLFLSAINAPFQSYSVTGTPVIVIIDEFHRCKDLYEYKPGDHKNLWMLFEEPIKTVYTPHIITGSGAKLRDMFFHETSLGESLELFNLLKLDKETSIKFSTLLCESYNITINSNILDDFVDLFNGNPFYIKNFLLAVRQEGKTFSENDLWEIYFKEITQGKFFTYWTSLLKTYVPRLYIRKTTLELLYNLNTQNPSTALSTLAKMSSESGEELEGIASLLQSSGILEMNFTVLEPVEDNVLTDFIKGLYCREVLEEPLNLTEEKLLKDHAERSKRTEPPLFEIVIPVMPKAELIAVKALEQIGRNLNIPSEITGNLQIALIDLLMSITQDGEFSGEKLSLKFGSLEDIFTIEVKTPIKLHTSVSSLSTAEKQLISKYTDDIIFENTKNGLKITLIKNLKHFAPTS